MIVLSICNSDEQNKGEFVAGCLELPASKDDVKELLSSIGVDGIQHKDISIVYIERKISGLNCLNIDDNIDEMNYLTALLSSLNEVGLDKFEAVETYGEHRGSVMELINLSQNLDCYEYYPDVSDYEELGRFLTEEFQTAKIPEWTENYFDYEAFGRNHATDVGGKITEYGFIYRNDVDFIIKYDGQDIPEEYRVFVYPDIPERKDDMDSAKAMPPISENEYVQELLAVMKANNLPSAKDLMNIIKQVGTMEAHIADMLSELTAMRRELAEAQMKNQPVKAALQKTVNNMQGQIQDLRDKLNKLKQHVIAGCKNALEAFKEKGLSALRSIADFFDIRSSLENMRNDLDKHIIKNEAAITRIESISSEYHEAGRHLKNVARVITGSKPLQTAKPIGKLAKAIETPYRADTACLAAVRRCVNKVINAVDRLEKAERKPPIIETVDRITEQINKTQRNIPTAERPARSHETR